MGEKKTCFIIMPITTPKSFLNTYGDDKEHFKHVLECIFVPSIEEAGLKAIPPKAKGDDVIQGKIIKELETADLVLCDMSTLNANVFFELGIRTSLNRPACMVKDELTDKVPFDTSIVNYHTYSGALRTWERDQQVEKLAEHIKETIPKGEAVNSLWKYFGLSSTAIPAPTGGVEERLEMLTSQIEAMRSERKKPLMSLKTLSNLDRRDSVVHSLTDFLSSRKSNYYIKDVNATANMVVVGFSGKPNEKTIQIICGLCDEFGFDVVID